MGFHLLLECFWGRSSYKFLKRCFQILLSKKEVKGTFLMLHFLSHRPLQGGSGIPLILYSGAWWLLF